MAFKAKELLSKIKDLLKKSQNSTLSLQDSNKDDNGDYLVAEVETETTTVSTKTTRRKLQLYTHTGRLVLLPKDYVFPKLTLATLITAWHCGNQDEGIPPYKHLSVKDVYHIKAGKHKIAMMRLLMDAVRRATIIKNQEDLLKKDMTIEDCSNLHNSVKHMFKIPGKNEKTRRHQTLSWKTIYN